MTRRRTLPDPVEVQRRRNARDGWRRIARRCRASVAEVRAAAGFCLACGAAPVERKDCPRRCAAPVCGQCGNHRGGAPDLDAVELLDLK
jgi:hypothetical protein